MNNINWYPGHMKKTREMIVENLKLVDVVVEIVDARIPISSRNPIIHQLLGQKPRVIALNKSDLADKGQNRLWQLKLEGEAQKVFITNSMTGNGIKEMIKGLEEVKNKREGNRAQKPFRLMIVGVPNVGKSSFINRMTGKKSTQIGDRPGVTKGKQWLTLKNGMQLLDTPGILWPKFEDPNVGVNLAFCGSIKDEILDTTELAIELIAFLQEKYEELICKRYNLEKVLDTPLETVEAIAKKRGFIMSKGRIDYERVGRTIVDEFRAGQIGNITIEQV